MVLTEGYQMVWILTGIFIAVFITAFIKWYKDVNENEKLR